MTDLTTNPDPHRTLAPFFDELCWQLLDQLACWTPPDNIEDDLGDVRPHPPRDPVARQRKQGYRHGAYEQLETLTRFICDNNIDVIACAQRYADRNDLDMPDLDEDFVDVLQDTTAELDQ